VRWVRPKAVDQQHHGRSDAGQQGLGLSHRDPQERGGSAVGSSRCASNDTRQQWPAMGRAEIKPFFAGQRGRAEEVVHFPGRCLNRLLEQAKPTLPPAAGRGLTDRLPTAAPNGRASPTWLIADQVDHLESTRALNAMGARQVQIGADGLPRKKTLKTSPQVEQGPPGSTRRISLGCPAAGWLGGRGG